MIDEKPTESEPSDTEPPKVTRRIRHMCLNVKGALLDFSDCDLVSMFSHDDGRPMTAREAKLELMQELVNGHMVIPFDQPCEGFDYAGGGCPGHEIAGETPE